MAAANTRWPAATAKRINLLQNMPAASGGLIRCGADLRGVAAEYRRQSFDGRARLTLKLGRSRRVPQFHQPTLVVGGQSFAYAFGASLIDGPGYGRAGVYTLAPPAQPP
jgi:hypothetical protein